MKHRDAYTLAEGKNMQQTSLGKTARCLVAVLVLVMSLALLACPGDDEEDFVNVDATVPANANTVVAVQNQQFTLPSGAVFNAGATPINFAFNSPTMVTIARGNSTATGSVVFASCTIVIQTSNFPAGQGPQVTQTFTFPTCVFRVQANNTEIGGDEVVGTITLILVSGGGVRVESSPIPIEVRIDDNGALIINDVDTGINVNVTGTTGTGGGS
jgi:hypothetical protein